MKINVRIEGFTPLLMNRYTDEAQQAATSGSAQAQVGERLSPRDDAESRLHTGPGGEVVIPTPMLLACITDAGKFHKNGRSKVTTASTSIVPAAVTIGPDVAVKLESIDGWSVDSRPVCIKATGGRIVRHRPIFHDWAVEFVMEVDAHIFSAKFARTLVDDAGKRCGLGDFRPNRKGPFGRFVVTKWEVLKDE